MKSAKFIKTLTALALSASLMSAPFSVMAADTAAAAQTTVSADSTASQVKNGWKKESVGYCYYENGKKVTGKWKVIKGKKYYFGSNGARKTGWYTIKNKSYYFNSKGVLKKSKSIDKKLVSAMDKVIKSQKLTENTAKKAALKKLFNLMQNKKNYGYGRAPLGFRPETASKNWEYTFAKEMLDTKKGSCYHYAAAYAFLAKRATGLPVRICLGTSNAFNAERWQSHGWVEIKIGNTWYTYDVNAAAFSSLRKGKWYQQKRSNMEGKIYKTQKTFNVEL